MKMWISKYALSSSIREEEGKIFHGAKEDYFAVGINGFYVIGVHAHETREAALVAAEAMRIKKIASLKKQISKLEKLEFSGEKE